MSGFSAGNSRTRPFNDNYSYLDNYQDLGNWRKANYSKNNYRQNNRTQGIDPASISGAKYGISHKSGQPWVSGWQKTRNGLITYFATPWKGASAPTYISNTTKQERMYMAVKIVYKNTGVEKLKWGWLNLVTKTLVIKDENVVIKPNSKARGGYCGKIK